MPRVFNLRAPGRKKPLALTSGLFWQPIMPSADPRKALRKIADEQKFDLYATPRTSSLQAGFGSVRDGLKAGWLSAAAVLSDYMEAKLESRSFVLALPVSDHVWIYVAQHNGVILPDGDLHGEAATVQSRLVTDLSGGGWTHVVAPAHWGISGALDLALDDVLAWADQERPKHRSWLLGRVQTDYKKMAFLAAGIGSLALAGYAGVQTWKAHAAAEQARLLAEARALMAKNQDRAVVAPKPWVAQAGATTTARACLDAFARADAFSTGWVLKQASCRNGALSLTWDRDGKGNLSVMRQRFPMAKIDLAGVVASVGIPLPQLQPGPDGKLPEASAAAESLQGRAQSLGVGLALTKVVPAAAVPGAAPVAPPSWTTLKWKVSGTRLPPDALVDYLASPSLRLSALDFDMTTQSWALEGELYANP